MVSCRESSFEEKSAVEKAFVSGNYKIMFSLPGDDFASAADLAQLQTLKGIIVQQGLGAPVGLGSGMGYMVLVVYVNSEDALSNIKGLMRDKFPDAQYKMTPELPFKDL